MGTVSSSATSNVRVRDEITFIGPDFFDTDSQGKLLCPIASVFPKYRAIVTGRGIHGMLAETMTQFLKDPPAAAGYREFTERDEEDVYRNAVSVMIRDACVLIRSEPQDMDRIFEADGIIQHFLPKSLIQFTGVHLASVRRALRNRGESWRMSPAPRTVEEIGHYIRSSQVHVQTGLTVYYNAPTGGRFVTYEEFMRIRPLLAEDRDEALDRLREILQLSGLVNSGGIPELSFLLPAGRKLSPEGIEEIVSLLESSPANAVIDPAVDAFDRFAAHFAEVAGPGLTSDDESNSLWRTTIFCRLYDINEQEIEEWALGLSPEFHLNVNWYPGGSVADGRIEMSPDSPHRVKGLIEYYWNRTGPFVSINVGRLEEPQNRRESAYEERQIYLVVITGAKGENIRLVRMLKWDVYHRIRLGAPLHSAIEDTYRYRQYIFDRLNIATLLGFPILSYSEIKIEEESPGLGVVPVFFFERRYVAGVASNKIPAPSYGDPEFILALCRLLGTAAAFSLILGRASQRTGQLFFDDGDELIQTDSNGIPERLTMIETTGSFANWTTPIIQMLPQCLDRVAGHIENAAGLGVGPYHIKRSVDAFAESLASEIARVQGSVRTDPEYFRNLFASRPLDPGGIRNRWNGILDRIENTDVQAIRLAAMVSILRK